jgi:tetratricopeptide (TPR) repeat protein
MTPQEINAAYRQTVRAIENKELKTAFNILTSLMAGSGDYSLSEELNSVENTYRQLLYYHAKGLQDPLQQKIYIELIIKLYGLADIIQRSLLMHESASYFYSVKRSLRTNNNAITASVSDVLSHAGACRMNELYTELSFLFKCIWTSDCLTEHETNVLNIVLTTPPANLTHIDETLMLINCQLVSALTLALQNFFDIRKIQLLFDAAVHPEPEVKVRAFVGLLLTFLLYSDRINSYKEIRYRLEVLAEIPDFVKIITMITQRFILSRQTDKITSKLKDEIIPEMLKMHPKYKNSEPVRFFTPDDFDADLNPEWFENLSKSNLHSKMEEFQKLQEEGSDVMLFSFINLKHFPFFHELANWFLPFDKILAAGNESPQLSKTFELFIDTGVLCNSDMYSFFFSLQNIAHDESNRLMASLEKQMEALHELKKAELFTRFNKLEVITGKYVQDLYRFFKLFPRHSDFNDVFAQRLDFYNVPLLTPLFDNDAIRGIAELCFKKGYYSDASLLFNRLVNANDDSYEILLQKIGYCFQLQGQFDSALKYYLNAETVNPDSKWLMRRMAQCYRSVKQPDKAIEYYFRYNKQDPDNISVLLGIGGCFLDAQNFDQALNYYFKADYLEPDSIKAWRPLAWCLFVTKKYEQAQKYYSKILNNRPLFRDYINAGHVELALGNIENAIEYYKLAFIAVNRSFDKFKKEMLADYPELISANIHPDTIPLVIDEMRYRLLDGTVNHTSTK